MNFARDYIDGLTSSYLDEYALGYTSKKIEIGLFQSCITLQELSLRPQTLHLGNVALINMEYGAVGRVKIDAPWTRFRSGHTAMNVNDVHLVFRVSPGDKDNPHISWLHQRKMASIEREEQRILHLSSSVLNGWSENILRSLKSQNIASLVNSFSLNMTSVLLSILIPVGESNELMHIRISLSEYSLSPTNSQNKDTAAMTLDVDKHIILKKYVDGRHVCVAIQRVLSCLDDDKTIFYDSLRQVAPDSLLVSPMHMMIDCSVCSERSQYLNEEANNTDSTGIVLDMKLSNVEITPNATQLLLIRDCIRTLSFKTNQRKYRHLRPSQSPASNLLNCKAWWQYAAAAVCIIRNESSRFAAMVSVAQGKDGYGGAAGFLTSNDLRRQYLVLYRQHLECRLNRLADPKRYAQAVAQNSSNGLPWRMPADQAEAMETLHRLLSHDDILTYRVMVHHGLRKAGTSLEHLKTSVAEAGASGAAERFSLYNTMSNLFAVKGGSSMSSVDIDKDILSLFHEVKELTEHSKKQNRIVYDMSLTVPRLAISWREGLPAYSHGRDGPNLSLPFCRASLAAMSASTPEASVTIVFYGFSGSYEQGETENDAIVESRVGALRVFGCHGVELVSCGEKTDAWLHNFGVEQARTEDLAVSLHMQWDVLQNRLQSTPVATGEGLSSPQSDSTTHPSTQTSATIQSLAQGNHKHLVVEVNMAKLTCFADSATMGYILTKQSEFEGSGLNMLGDIRRHIDNLRFVRQKCAHHSISKSIGTRSDGGDLFEYPPVMKLSLELVFHGLSILFPMSAAGRRGEVLTVSCNTLSIISGDYLANTIWMKSLGKGDGMQNRDLWMDVDRIIGSKLRAVRRELTNPIVVSAAHIEVTEMNASSPVNRITEVAWNVKGLLSICSYPCHTGIPDIQLDVYGSPLEIECTFEKIIEIWDAVHDAVTMLRVWWMKNGHASKSIPRVALLSSLVEMQSNIRLDRFSCVIVNKTSFARAEIAKHSLQKYRDLLRSRGTFSRIAHTAERLVIQKCNQLGLDAKKAEHAVRSINSLAAEHSTVPIDGETKSSHDPLTQLLREIITMSCLPSQPIIKVVLNHIHTSRLKLTYDERFTISINEILITGNSCNSIVHIFGSKKDVHRDVETHKIREGKTKISHFSPLQKSNRSDAAERLYPCGFFCSYKLFDNDYDWGMGGESVRSLYSSSLLSPPDLTYYREVECKVLNMDLVVNPHSVAELLRSCAGFYSNIAARSDIRRALCTHLLFVFDQDVNSFRMDIGCAHVVFLMQEDSILAEWCVRAAKINTHTNAPCGDDSADGTRHDDGSNSADLQCLQISCEVVELHDLSTAGSVHPSTLLRTGTGARVDPMLFAEVCFRHLEAIDVRVCMDGAQMCLLARFLEEIAEFSSLTQNVIGKEWKAHYENSLPVFDKHDTQSMQSSNPTNEYSDTESDSSSNKSEDWMTQFAQSRQKEHVMEHNLRDHDNLRNFYRKGPLNGPVGQRRRNGVKRGKALPLYLIDTITNDSPKWSWTIDLVDSVLIFPRNSASNDLIALTVKSISIVNRKVLDSWQAPESFRMGAPDDFIYFDCFTNDWRSSGVQEDSSSSNESMDTKVFENSASVSESKLDYPCGHEDVDMRTRHSRGVTFAKSTALRLFGESQQVEVEEYTTAHSDDPSPEKHFTADFLHASGTAEGPPSSAVFRLFPSQMVDDAELLSSPLPNGKEPCIDDIDMDSSSSSSSSSIYDFEDTIEAPLEDAGYSLHQMEVNTSTPARNSSPFRRSTASEFKLTDSHKIAASGLFTRVEVRMTGVQLLSSIAGQMKNSTEGVDPQQLHHRRFLEVVDGACVYSVVDESRTYSTSDQTWSMLSQESTDALLVFDFVDEKLRILVSENSTATPIHCKLTIAQYYLFMSIFLDNGCEDGAFFRSIAHEEDTFVPCDPASLSFRQRLFFHRLPRQSQFKGVYPEYGTVDYLEYLRHLSSLIDIVVARSDVDMECAMDTSDFACDIPSAKMLFKYHGLSADQTDPLVPPVIEPIPFLRIKMQWLALSCALGTSGQQIGIGVGGVVITDIRNPFQPREIYRTASAHTARYHGYGDLNYGLKNSVSELCTGFGLDIPLKITIFTVGHAWHTVNCGCSFPDIDLKDLDIVLLMIDYYSLYFRNREFGNPVVAARARIDAAAWPYGGVDLRVFMHKPHMQIAEDEVKPKKAQVMVIEANGGAHVRLMFDSNRSLRTEVRVYDLAVIMLRSYKVPSIARGLRGTAGSGRGVRTILEFMDVGWSYSLNEVNEVIDYLLSITPSQRTAEVDKLLDMKNHIAGAKRKGRGTLWNTANLASTSNYVDLDGETLFVPAVEVTPPKCIPSTYIPPRIFPRACCSVVTSYEDVKFAVSLVSSFFFALFELTSDVQFEDMSNSMKGAMLRKVFDTPKGYNVYATVKFEAVMITIVDNVLGLHLPLVQTYLSSVCLSINSIPSAPQNNGLSNSERSGDMMSDDPASFRKNTTKGTSNSSIAWRSTRMISTDSVSGTSRGSRGVSVANPLDSKPRVYAVCEGLVWTDFFNNMLKCWEPLIEPISFTTLYGQNPERGRGLTLRVSSDIHINVSVSMLKALDEAVNAIRDILNASWERFSNGDADEDSNSLFHIPSDTSDPRTHTEEDSQKYHDVAYYENEFDGMINSDAFWRNGVVQTIEHVKSVPLHIEAKVGFSILNLTGYPIRYLQMWEDGQRMTCEYLEHGQRGLLNFIASNTLIRDNDIVEESFSLQTMSTTTSQKSSNSAMLRHSLGHQVALQIAGYQWLRSVQADALGIRFEELQAVIGMLNMSKICKKWQIRNALKLVTEVRSHNGGRMLQLNSTFVIKNMTNHAINLLTYEVKNSSKISEDNPFVLKSGESFNVPLALLYRSVLKSDETSLGFIWMAPQSMTAIVEELGVSSHMISGTSYSSVPVDLMDMVNKTTQLLNNDGDNASAGHDMHMQLSCQLLGISGRKKRKSKNMWGGPPGVSYAGPDGTEGMSSSTARIINFDNLPKFCYSIELESVNGAQSGFGDATQGPDAPAEDGTNSSQCIYSIAIHPPIVLENMLPVRGTFELVHAVHKSVLWSDTIDPQATASIHTVSLHDPILLLINLDFCRSSEGAFVHKPPSTSDEGRGLTETVIEGFKGLLDDNHLKSSHASIMLTDSVGQRLRLKIENKLGGGGNRRIAVYCPYWVVNSSQYSLRLREDGAKYLPAGTVTARKDGRAPVTVAQMSTTRGHMLRREQPHGHDVMDDAVPRMEEKVFPGRPGPLHSSIVTAIHLSSPLQTLLHDLNFVQILEMSSMFNFFEDTESRLIGSQKVIAQLDDSSWSSAFTLESAGVNQVLSVDHSERGTLELAFKVYTAPGRLSNYTKIVRFSPRFVVVNKMDINITMIQVNGFLIEKVPIVVPAGHLRPFHLPAVFGERQVALDIEGPWLRSIGFDIDRLGSYAIRVRRTIDTSRLEHILTRGTPEYEVALPTGEVGIWFETDWDNEQVVVKRIKPESVAATRTDIQPGDVLLTVNGVDIAAKAFEDVMGLIKRSQQRDGSRLTFQTIEEKMRLLRENAMAPAAIRGTGIYSAIRNTVPGGVLADKNLREDDDREIDISVDLRAVDLSIFLTVSLLDKNVRPEYRVVNKSPSHVIHYRQKGIFSGRWSSLGPGESASYIFDDPMKSHRLLIRTGKNLLCLPSGRLNWLAKINDSIISHFSVGVAEKNYVTAIPFDEIGFKTNVPVGGSNGKLVASVQSDGPTKVLAIASDDAVRDMELKYSMQFVCEQMSALNTFVVELEAGKDAILSRESDVMLQNMINECLSDIKDRQQRCLRVLMQQQDDMFGPAGQAPVITCDHIIECLLGPVIKSLNAMRVEVVEATGLKPAVLGGTDETYCELVMKVPQLLQRKQFMQKQSTYLNDQTLDPIWVDQIFHFDVPVLATEPIRGYYIRVIVKSRSVLGEDSFLGQADIPFTSLISEEELFGWFPLKPKKYSIRSSPGSLQVSGSIKLRLQWVHSVKALYKHTLDAANRRLQDLIALLDVNNKHLGQVLKLGINIPKKPQQLLRTTEHTSQRTHTTSDKHNKRERFEAMLLRGMDAEYSLREHSPTPRLIRPHETEAFAAVNSHTRKLQANLASHTASHLPREPLTMKRKANIELSCFQFTLAADYELSRNFEVVRATHGKLIVAPIRAINIPHSSRLPIFVQMSYGDQIYRTKEVASSSASAGGESSGGPNQTDGSSGVFQWAPMDDDCMNHSHRGSMHAPLGDDKGGDDNSKSFHIDTLNIRGSICVSLFKEKWYRQKEIAHVDIPIFGILDCICVPDTDHMTRWFYLDTKRGTFPPASEAESVVGEDEGPDFENNCPCICICFRWIPNTLKFSDVTTPKVHSRLTIPSLSLSLIDSEKVREILHFYMSGVDIRYSDAVEVTETSVNISWLQIDNQLPEASYSVILSPTAILRPQPVIRIHIRRNNSLCHEHLASYDMIILIVQELDLHLEQQTVTALWDITQNFLMEQASKVAHNESPLGNDSVRARYSSPMDPTMDIYQSTPDDDKIYCDYFYIAPIMIHVSFITGNTGHSDGSSDMISGQWDANNLTRGLKNIPLDHSTPVSLFLWQVGAVVLELTSSISDATIELHGMTVSNLFKTIDEVASILQEHYLNSTLGQVYRIVGSLDLVTNPVGLLSSLGDGVRDFFFEPAHALVKNPTEISKIGGELMKGAFSLARSTADGVLGTATIMTRSVGKGVAILTMDDTFLQNRDKLNKHPDSAIGFVLRPMQDIGNGVYCGLVGVVRVPYHGARRNGAIGFASGLGKGIAGIATKPVVGILDSITHIGEGVRYAVKSLQSKRGAPAERQRYCSLFGLDGRVLPYSYSAAYGSHVLRLLENSHRSRLQLPFNHGVLHSSSAKRDSWHLPTSAVEDQRGDSDVVMHNQPKSSFWDSVNRRQSLQITSDIPTISQFTLARARRRSVSDPGRVINQLESVIYAAVLPGSSVRGCLVIVTSLRVVVAEHHRERGDAHVGIRWQCRTKFLAPPVIASTEGGSAEMLVLREKFLLMSADRNEDTSNTVNVVSSDSDKLHMLYNCLNIILGNFSAVEKSSYDVWMQDERGVIHLGPWQYRRHRDAPLTVPAENMYLEQLEATEWKIITSHDVEKAHQPKWLSQDNDTAINSHANVTQLIAASEPSITDNETIHQLKQQLVEGSMTAEEFGVFMEKEKLYGAYMHQYDGSSMSSSFPSGTDLPSGASKRGVGALKKLRNKVRRTISLFTPNSDSATVHSEDGKSQATQNRSTADEGTATAFNDPLSTSTPSPSGSSPKLLNMPLQLMKKRVLHKKSTHDSSFASSISEVSTDNDASPKAVGRSVFNQDDSGKCVGVEVRGMAEPGSVPTFLPDSSVMASSAASPDTAAVIIEEADEDEDDELKRQEEFVRGDVKGPGCPPPSISCEVKHFTGVERMAANVTTDGRNCTGAESSKCSYDCNGHAGQPVPHSPVSEKRSIVVHDMTCEGSSPSLKSPLCPDREMQICSPIWPSHSGKCQECSVVVQGSLKMMGLNGSIAVSELTFHRIPSSILNVAQSAEDQEIERRLKRVEMLMIAINRPDVFEELFGSDTEVLQVDKNGL